jgi:acetolactate synthase-1/2/3 large subunit
LKQLMAEINVNGSRIDTEALAAWWDQIKEWQSVNCLEYDRESALIKPQYVVEQLYKVTAGNAFITSDVGQHQMYAAQFYPFDEPRRWINSGGLGTMGFGLPAAIGVKLAHPDADVACITGEASIQMCIQELSTAQQYQTPVKIINLNNRYMGMVRQWQEFSYEGRYSHSYLEALPDFVKLAEAYGHVGMQIDKPEDVTPALEEAFAMKDRTVFLDIITDQKENVYPMIEAGKGHHDMRLRVAPGTPIDRELA